MSILLLYSTNSGSTFVVARTIASTLSPKHQVIIQTAKDTTAQDIQNANIILFGSPSWDFNGKEGQPHEDIIALLLRLETTSLKKKKIALFGCGDSSYTFFCGAIDVLESWISSHGGSLLLPSLRLNEFFFHEKENLLLVTDWTKKIQNLL